MSCHEINNLNDIIASFRQEIKTFSDTTRWSDGIVEEALYAGFAETNSARWGKFENCAGNFRRRGVFYFTAHYLIDVYPLIGSDNEALMSTSVSGRAVQKKIGDESVTYRISGLKQVEDDWLTTTKFGVLFLRLRRRAGMGAMAV